MGAQLLKLWDRARASFWFVPALMVIAAIVAALAMVTIDDAALADDEGGIISQWLSSTSWVYSGNAEAAIAVLQTIATSMATIVGLVFSLTLVAMSLASSQFGPRLLRHFMRDRTTQVVLGTFVSTFIYCLIVLRSVRAGEESFVPHLSISLGVFLAIASMALLVYFIHHVSVSIEADEIVHRVEKEIHSTLDHLYAERMGQPPGQDTQPALPQDFEREARPVLSPTSGYLQVIDGESLMKLASEKQAVLRITSRPGDYVTEGSTLVLLWPGDRVDDELSRRINRIFAMGKQRSAMQDAEYTFLQLVELAVRALSPAQNDPFTACACVDRLGTALRRLAQREMPSPYRLDDEGQLRVVAWPVTFRRLVDSAFNQIRQSARSDAAVTLRLLETIARIAEVASAPDDLSALRRQADMILRGARTGLPEEEDLSLVEKRYETASRLLLKKASLGG